MFVLMVMDIFIECYKYVLTLPFHEIDIHCERYQYNRFKPTQDNLNFIFYEESNIRWDRKRVGSIDTSGIDKYDKLLQIT